MGQRLARLAAHLFRPAGQLIDRQCAVRQSPHSSSPHQELARKSALAGQRADLADQLDYFAANPSEVAVDRNLDLAERNHLLEPYHLAGQPAHPGACPSEAAAERILGLAERNHSLVAYRLADGTERLEANSAGTRQRNLEAASRSRPEPTTG